MQDKVPGTGFNYANHRFYLACPDDPVIPENRSPMRVIPTLHRVRYTGGRALWFGRSSGEDGPAKFEGVDMAGRGRGRRTDVEDEGPDLDPEWIARIRSALIAWYNDDHRRLPWRNQSDPYRILVAEIMLVQTTVEAVTPFYQRFLDRFPDLASLASADESEVLKAWEGLGYYRRARQLHASARRIVQDHGGRVPSDPEALRDLPGVGRYIAGAVLSFAFGQPAAIVEANTQRVLCRWLDWPEPLGTSKPTERLWRAAGRLVTEDDPGTITTAFMELGAVLCTPTQPRCLLCPALGDCRAQAAGTQADRPLPAKRPEVLDVVEACVLALDPNGRILLLQRAPDQLWAGFWELPTIHLSGADPAGRRLDKSEVAEDQGGETNRIALDGSEQVSPRLKETIPRLTGVTLRSVGPAVREIRYGVTRHRVRLHVFPAFVASVEGRSVEEIPIDPKRLAAGHIAGRWVGLDEWDPLSLGAATRRLLTWAQDQGAARIRAWAGGRGDPPRPTTRGRPMAGSTGKKPDASGRSVP